MRKRLLCILLVATLIIATCAFAACTKDEEPDDGSWTAETKFWSNTMTAVLTFDSETTWKLEAKGSFYPGQWQSGTYRFEGEIGKSTLYMTATQESPNTFLQDKKIGEEASYEPVDGVYTIVFNLAGTKNQEIKFKPPVDGTKPGATTQE